jgi:hypothetical protein
MEMTIVQSEQEVGFQGSAKRKQRLGADDNQERRRQPQRLHSLAINININIHNFTIPAVGV